MTIRRRAGNGSNERVGSGRLLRPVSTPAEVSKRPRDAGLNLTEAHLRDIFLVMAEGLVFQASDGRIIDANPAAERILGLSRRQLLGKSSMDPDWQAIREDGTPFAGPEHPAMVTLRTGQPIHNQIMGVRTPDGELRWLSINSQPIFATGSTQPSAVVVTFVDITRQSRLTDELRGAQEDLRAILDNVPARITSWNADSTNHFVNKSAAVQFGIVAEAAVGKYCWEILDAERYSRAKPYIDAALAGERQTHEQVDAQTDGSVRYSQVTYVPKCRDGKVEGLYALATDVTEQRESHRRSRELAQRLETVREEERRSIAQVLHEGIAQDLFALKLRLQPLQTQGQGREGVTKACEELGQAIDQCMGAVRQIALDLRPSALAHLRVSVAIEEHARYFAGISGLAIRVVERAQFPELTEADGLLLFRAAQEALTNVVRHAKASRVDIVLRAENDTIAMDIIDDGIGLEAEALSKAGSLGLLGVQERVGALGGVLAIQRNAGAGTTLSVQLPRSAGLGD